MRTLAKVLIAAAAAIGLCLVALRTPYAQQYLGGIAGSLLGENVRISRIRLSLLPPQGLGFADATVEDPVTKRPVLSIADLRVGLRPRDWSGSAVDVGPIAHARWVEGMALLLINNNFGPLPAFNVHLREVE